MYSAGGGDYRGRGGKAARRGGDERGDESFVSGGYGRAAAILDSMERQGLIGPIDGAKPRQVLGRAHELVSDWDEQGL